MYRHSVLVVLLVLPAIAQAQEADKPVLVMNTGGHLWSAESVMFTPDGSEVISTGWDGIHFWSVKTGETVRVLRPMWMPGWGGGVAALSPDGKMLAMTRRNPQSGEQWIYLIELPAGRISRVIPTEYLSETTKLVFSPDGKYLASGAGDASARLWNTQTGACEKVLRGHTGSVRGLAFSPDSRLLATAGKDETVRIWSVADGKTKTILKDEDKRTYAILEIVFSPDGESIVASCGGGGMRIWNLDGTVRKRLGNGGGEIRFTADPQRVLTGGTSGMILDLTTDKPLVEFTRHSTGAWVCALSPDGKLAVTGGSGGGNLFLWRVNDGSLVHHLTGVGKTVFGVGWSSDGKRIAWGNSADAQGFGTPASLEQTFHLGELQFEEARGQYQRFQATQGNLSLKRDGNSRNYTVMQITKEVSTIPGGMSFTFQPEGRVFVATGGSLHLYDARTGKSLRRFWEGAGPGEVCPSPDGRYLLGGCVQFLRIWSIERSEPLLSLFIGGNEWVAYTPEGYYAASPGGEKLMGWQVNHGHDRMATFYSAAQFRKTLYRPDVIKLLLETGSVEKALEKADKARGKASQRTEIDKVLPPKVAITSPDKTGLKLDKPEVEVKAAAESVGDHPVTALRLLIDGRPYQGEAGIQKIAEPKLGKTETSWTVKIEPGKHTLAVQAESAVSKAVSDEIEVFGEGTRGLGKTPEQLPDKTDVSELPNLYVLAVGVSAYKGDRKLNYAAKDAEALAKACQEKSKALFRQVEVKLITDEKATRREILQGLTWLRKQMTQRDVGIIFFAGHGMKDSDSSFYLLPVDGDPDDLLSTAVPGEQVKRTLASVPGKIMVLLDACHAGAADGGEKRRAATSLTDDLVRDLVTDDYGVIVMCSSMGREYALESAAVEHGYFTLALTEGLSGKAANKDGVVYLHTLDAYVTDRVKELTKGRQHPVTAKPSTIRSFPLAKP